MKEIARDVAVVPMLIVNAYLVGTAKNWILIDAGTPGNAEKIRQAAEARFGPGAKPRAIILTHGHFDHAGSAKELAAIWDVNVYAHRMERPFLTGKSPYPPMDPTAPGFFAALGRFMPSSTANVGDRLIDFEDSSLLLFELSGWEAINTPGHTPGHVAFFRRDDGLLLAGDAFATMNTDNVIGMLTKKKQISRPAVPATTNWQQARLSVQALAKLRPRVIGAGHGAPMNDAADELETFAAHFPVPEHGRYVNEPARFDENGIAYLPPPPPDNGPKVAAGVVAGLAVAGVGVALLRKNSGE